MPYDRASVSHDSFGQIGPVLNSVSTLLHNHRDPLNSIGMFKFYKNEPLIFACIFFIQSRKACVILRMHQSIIRQRLKLKKQPQNGWIEAAMNMLYCAYMTLSRETKFFALGCWNIRAKLGVCVCLVVAKITACTKFVCIVLWWSVHGCCRYVLHACSMGGPHESCFHFNVHFNTTQCLIIDTRPGCVNYNIMIMKMFPNHDTHPIIWLIILLLLLSRWITDNIVFSGKLYHQLCGRCYIIKRSLRVCVFCCCSFNDDH